MTSARMTIGALAIMCLAGVAAPASAQAPAAAPANPAVPGTAHGQASVTVDAPIQLLGVSVRVAAPDPISYLGSAYRDDLGGQSESGSDPAIAENARGGGSNRPDAW